MICSQAARRKGAGGRLRANLVPVIFVVSCLAGCGTSGPTKYPVGGIVSHQGKPLPTGQLMLVPADGPPAIVTIEAGGRYQLSAVAGKHRVAVTALQGGKTEPVPDGTEGGYRYVDGEPKALVPEKFNRHETSGVEIEVKGLSEQQTINIDLP